MLKLKNGGNGKTGTIFACYEKNFYKNLAFGENFLKKFFYFFIFSFFTAGEGIHFCQGNES
jgi:hypothetical protein